MGKRIVVIDRTEIFAEDGENFQEYVYENGEKVPAGTLIGYELKTEDGYKLELKKGIYYAN